MNDDSKPKVVTAGEFNPTEKKRAFLEGALRDMRDGLTFQIELAQIQAKLSRAKYLALVHEGFTEAQAIALCKGT